MNDTSVIKAIHHFNTSSSNVFPIFQKKNNNDNYECLEICKSVEES